LRKDTVADAQRAAGDHGGSQPAPSCQRDLGRLAGHPVQVAARLTRPVTLQHHLADPKCAPDQRLQVNPARLHVAACRTALQVHPVFGAGSVQRLGSDESDVVVQPPVIAPLAGAGLVTVANQPLAGYRHSRLDRPHRQAAGAGEVHTYNATHPVDANRRNRPPAAVAGSAKQPGDGMIHLVDGRGSRSGLDGPAHGSWPPGCSGRDEDLELLCSAPLLDGLDPPDVAALLPAFRFATVDVDQELLTQGESGGPQMFIVLDGRFAVTRRHRGGRAVSAVLGPGDCVGELSVFDPGRDTSTVRALTAARVAVLCGQDLLEWATTRPHAAARLLHVLARRLHRTDAAVFDLAVLDVQRRVANALLDFAARFGEPHGSTVQVAHGLTQVQLAQLVGASRERVNKALSDFASRGWLRQERRSVVLTDLARLSQWAQARASP